MKTRMTRISAFLMSAVLLVSMSGCSGGKKRKEMKKLAEGVVENYLVFLSTGKFDKLSRYCDPKDDQFQDILDLNSKEKAGTDIYPHPDYLPYWKAYLSHLKFTLGEFSLDDDNGKIEVEVDLIDAKKALRSSVEPSSEDILYYLTDADVYTNKSITFSLDCDTDNGTCTIKNTQALFKECKKQFDIVLDELPMKNSKLDGLLREFMDHAIAMDMDYLESDGFYLGFEPSVYSYHELPYYRAMTSFYSYEYEFVDGSDDWAEFKMTVTKKDEESALFNFFHKAANIAPSFEKFLSYAIKAPKGYNGLEELWPIDPLIPGFTDSLSTCDDKTIIVRGEIRLDPHVPLGYRITGVFDDVFPTIITDDYAAVTADPVFSHDIYTIAAENLLKKGSITEKEYERLQRLLNYDLSYTKYEATMMEHGYTQSARGTGGFHSYSKGERILVDVETFSGDNGVDSAVIESMHSYSDLEIKIANGEFPGELTGGWGFFEFYGKTTTGDLPPEDTYICCVAVENRLFTFTIYSYTEEDISEIKALMHELQLD